MRAFLLLLFLMPGAAWSATFFVTKEVDDAGPCMPDDCALREAVLAANNLPGPDVVEVPGGTYQLSLPGPSENFSMSGDIDILEDLVLRGESARTVTLIGDGSDRVLEVNTLGGSVEISNLTITGGSVTNAGGGLRVTGPEFILLRNLTVRDNTSLFGFGGGLFIAAIDIATLRNITVSGNSAPMSVGGGIDISASPKTSAQKAFRRDRASVRFFGHFHVSLISQIC